MVGGTVEDIINPNLKKFRGLYAMRDTEESQWQEKKQHIHDFGNLSLFRDMESESEHSVGHQDAERPITPINESIKTAPKSYGSLSKLILRRIHPRPEWSHISLEDQSSLGAVIMGEVNAAWPLLRKQVSDPFLTHQQNRELQRRISVHCVTVCEHMFLHYAEKVKTLNSKGVFTNSANMSRIRAQLALETGKYLNILSVRRYIIADLKKPPLKEKITFSREKVTRSPTTPLSAPSPKRLSFRKLIKSSRPSRKFKYQFNLNAEIQNMQAMMPSISLSKVQQIQSLIDKSQALMQSETEEEYVEDKETLEFGEEELETKKKMDAMSDSSLPRFLRQRYPSEPLIQHTLLLDEMLQIEKEEEDYLLMRSPSQAPESHFDLPPNTPISLRESNQILSQSSLGLATVPPPDLASIDIKDPKEDLKLLVAKEERRKRKEKAEADAGKVDEESDDLPPLIQAITRRQIQDENLRQLQKKEVELDKKSEEDLKKKMKPLPPPQHPQPAIIQHKLPGSSNPVTRTPFTIRASDVKINDQVDLSAVTLQSYLPVYNDLTGDISQATVKELDANLFQGGELREVYSEIMKTVPNIHQQYDNDPLIMPPASNVDLSKILASSTLVRPRSQQVINPKLKKDDFDMPWEGQQLNWQKGSMRPHSAFQDSDVTSMSQGHGEGYTAFHRFTPSQLNHPGVEKGSRAYASWLQWWKNTINSDDFFKYLSTQDTDFLSVIFHFYDSDFGDSELESMRTAKMESQREREKKLAILKKEKEEFVPGFWNTKTVTLGGLGKDPEIEEENDFSDFETPQSTNRSQPLLESEARSSSATPRISLGRSSSSPRGTTFSSPRNKSNLTESQHSKQESEQEISIQERLEIVWRKLRMPDSQKLNCALKYSSDEYIKRLPEIVSSWERVTDAILRREALMTNLEMFEKEASDPNRFFEKGQKGSSAARLSEAKTRATLYKKLEALEMIIKASLASIKSRYSDTITFDGRPYMEKMDSDKIEMLYYLQQERRCVMLKDHGHSESLEAFLGHGQARVMGVLPPINKRFNQIPVSNVCLSVPE